jgi:hypothetical protein
MLLASGPPSASPPPPPPPPPHTHARGRAAITASSHRHTITHDAHQDALIQLLFDESALELALLVAGHVEARRFRDDAPLLMDLLAVIYDVSCVCARA